MNLLLRSSEGLGIIITFAFAFARERRGDAMERAKRGGRTMDICEHHSVTSNRYGRACAVGMRVIEENSKTEARWRVVAGIAVHVGMVSASRRGIL